MEWELAIALFAFFIATASLVLAIMNWRRL